MRPPRLSHAQRSHWSNEQGITPLMVLHKRC
jgi:hypothetical protein